MASKQYAHDPGRHIVLGLNEERTEGIEPQYRKWSVRQEL